MNKHGYKIKKILSSGLRRLALLPGLFLLVTVAVAQNLAVNPGFETGNTSNWFAFGSPPIAVESSQVNSGNYAASVTGRTQTYMGIAQSFQGILQPNQTYNVSVWVRLSAGASQTMQVTMQQIDGSGTTYIYIGSATVSTGGWTQLSGQFTLNVNDTLTGLILYIEVPSSATAAYFADDLDVELASPPPLPQCSINWTNVFQRIDGFGASSAWDSSWTAAQADMFFNTNTGAGLSFLRSRIAPGGTTIENSIMQLAQARGARVWSTPWSPPTNFKSTNDNGVISLNGGAFASSSANYQAYASQFAGYVVNMKNNYGVNLYALSIQNEPDYDTTNYESCVWSGQQIHDFIPYLAAALTASNVASTKIIIPESNHWLSNPGLYTNAMNDATVAPLVGIIANHNYDGVDFNTGDTNPPAAINSYGKALWETEVSTGDPYDGSISNAIYWAGRIHQFMTVAQANAWHYWWLVPAGNDNEGLTDASGNPAKRLYAFGQFARFVRPNYYRIDVPTNSGPLQISAYKDPASGNFAIVAINSGTADVSQIFNLTAFAATNITPWITSATLSLAGQTPVAVSGNIFTSTVPAMSIVTLAGWAVVPNTPPSLTPLADQTINTGFTLLLTNVATDASVPPPILTFSLLNGPTNATVDATNGIFLWRPLVSQAGMTNSVSVQVADNGSPSLTATNQFKIKVNTLSQTVLNSITITNGHVRLGANGTTGPDYTLLTSTDLFNWQPVVKSNSPVLPVVLVDTNQIGSARFYRIQIGP